MVHVQKLKKPPLKIPTLIKEEQKKEDNTKNLQKYHQHWNDWKLQTHWNTLEWVVPRSRNVEKKPFFTSYNKFKIEYKAPKNHWVGHSLMKPIDDDKFFNGRFIISELESSLNNDEKIGT